MRVKTAKRESWWRASVARRKTLKRMLFVLYTLAVFFLGVLIHRDGRVGAWYGTARKMLKVDVRGHVAEGLLATPKRLFIDMNFMNFQKLSHQRETALKRGILIKGDDDYVKAVIRHKGKSVPVDMRLKGDWDDHLKGNKWSFRIRARGDHTLFGMKQFSIHHPRARNYLAEWVYHEALRREDVLSLRYDFVRVTLNGKDLGVYALEEHFDKRLVENRQRREGPIIRFNETRFWEEQLQIRQFGETQGRRMNGTGFFFVTEIDAFQTKKWLADPSKREIHNRAISLLESFRRDQLKTSDVFDTKKLACYLAITDLMGAEHGSRWHNIRFYYNPITAKLEPIGFDANCGTTYRLTMHLSGPGSSFYGNLFKDPKFFEHYLIELERIARREYLDNFFDDIAEKMNRNLRILYSENPFYRFSKEMFYINQHYIQSVLEPVGSLVAYYHRNTSEQLELRIGNVHSIPVRVLGVVHGTLVPDTLGKEQKPIATVDRADGGVIEFQPLSVQVPRGMQWSDAMISNLRVRYQLLGANTIRETHVIPWPYRDDIPKAADLMRAEFNVLEFPFLEVEETAKTVSVKPGKWSISRDLIVPRGYTFRCGAGTHLSLTAGASILSYAPLEFWGSEENPIRIISPEADGQGVFVVEAGRLSTLKHVSFENLSQPSKPGWSLTGAVTFYKSAVEFHHCHFEGNRSEDGLNLVRSPFLISDCNFARTKSDAVDADFCKGTIRRSRFFDCGNDAIDISGSVVTLEQIRIEKAGDKAVSVGENSRLTARNLSISDSYIAFGVKDKSNLQAQQISIAGCTCGFALFQKKSEFGPASASVTQLQMRTTKTPYRVERGSKLLVDGANILADRNRLKIALD